MQGVSTLKTKKFMLSLLILLTLGLFLLGNQMTPVPGTSSGNGNPALLIVFVLVPLFICVVALWVYLFRGYSTQVNFLLVGMIVISLHLTAAFFYQKNELKVCSFKVCLIFFICLTVFMYINEPKIWQCKVVQRHVSL